jgi:Domain of unknown function (DUF2760)
LNRLVLAFRSFFALLFDGALPPEITSELGLIPKPAPVPPAPVVKTSDGALQLLGILQRDGRLLDFLLEDIGAYSDEQVGAAVRDVQLQCRESLNRYAQFAPVLDAAEGSYVKTPAASKPEALKFIGNVPAGTPAGGLLRHRGWRAVKMELPALNPQQDSTLLAPAELEVE